MVGRGLTARVVALEGGVDNTEMRLLLNSLSDAELERLEQLIIARDAGELPAVEELADDDLRILAKIKVVKT